MLDGDLVEPTRFQRKRKKFFKVDSIKNSTIPLVTESKQFGWYFAVAPGASNTVGKPGKVFWNTVRQPVIQRLQKDLSFAFEVTEEMKRSWIHAVMPKDHVEVGRLKLSRV